MVEVKSEKKQPVKNRLHREIKIIGFKKYILIVLASEVIKHDIFSFNSNRKKHIDYGLVHDRWTTKIVLTIFWRRMILQILFKENIVNKSCWSSPVIIWLRLRKGHMPFEVREFILNRIKILNIEHLSY